MEVSGNVRSIVGRVEGNNGPERRGSDSESRPPSPPPHLAEGPTSPPSSCSKFFPPLQPFSYAAADKEGGGEEGISFLPFSFYLRQWQGRREEGAKGVRRERSEKDPFSPFFQWRTKRRKSIVQKVCVYRTLPQKNHQVIFTA